MSRAFLQAEARVKQEYLTGWLNTVDRLLHGFDRIDDVLAIWNVRQTRAAAWANGEALWALRGDAQLLRAEYPSPSTGWWALRTRPTHPRGYDAAQGGTPASSAAPRPSLVDLAVRLATAHGL
jgi:hypothetical protein